MARSLFPPDGPDQGQVMRLPGHSEGGEQNIKRKVCACHTVCVRACACVCVCVSAAWTTESALIGGSHFIWSDSLSESEREG